MNSPSEDNPVCIECGLFEGCRSPFMKMDGNENPKILVIGEAPGDEEDRQGKPFVGRSGKLLRNALEGVGVDLEEVAFTNVVRCRPPENKLSKKALVKCREFIMAELESINPEVVFLTGNSPLSSILGETGITTWNGVAVEKDGIKFMPIYHPAFILRDNNYMDAWLEAMMRAFEESDADEYEYFYPKTLEEVNEMRSFFEPQEFIAYDIETASLDAFSDYSSILSVSFAAGNRAYSVVVDHPEGTWSDEDFQILVNILSDILKSHDGKIIGHNIKFDYMHTRNILDCDFRPGGDTMLISHLLDSKPGIHGLKHLAGVYLGMYDYEKELNDYVKEHPEANPKKGGSYGNVPLNILEKYGALDAKATFMLEEKLYDKLSDKQKIFYGEIVIPATYALGRMQYNGFNIDKYIARRYVKIYSIIKAQALDAIKCDKYVKDLVEDNTIPGKKPFIFNPGSVVMLRELYFKYYDIPVVAKTETGKPSTSGKLYRDYENEFPILRKIRMYKLMTKMLSTYLVPASENAWTSDDGLVHTSYNQHGTITGRLSSSDPVNLQNIPTPDREPGTILAYLPIKNIFTHRKWVEGKRDVKDFDTGALAMLDYNGMELRVFASCSGCEKMLKIFNESDVDVHTMVGSMLSGIPYEQITKAMRYKYKWTSWTLLYGGDEYTLSALYDIPLDECQRAVAEYYDIFPEVLEYKKWTQEYAEDHGYIESVFGRRELLPYITDEGDIGRRNSARRAAVNMPIQSAASDTVMCALVIADTQFREKGMRSLLVNTVHDSIVIDMPKEEIEEAVKICKNAMENVKIYGKKYFPHVDFSWLKSRLKVDVEIGTHYGSGIEYEKWEAKHGDKTV